MILLVPILPWWFLSIIATGFIIRFRMPFEVLLSAFFFDNLYSLPLEFLFFPMTIFFGIIILFSFFLKPRLAFYR